MICSNENHIMRMIIQSNYRICSRKIDKNVEMYKEQIQRIPIAYLKNRVGFLYLLLINSWKK